jgi:hypothetical protein
MGPLSWDEKGDLKGFEFGVFDWHANGTAFTRRRLGGFIRMLNRARLRRDGGY